MLSSMQFWKWPAGRSIKLVACLHKMIDVMWILHGDDMIWELQHLPWQTRYRLAESLGLLPSDLPEPDESRWPL